MFYKNETDANKNIQISACQDDVNRIFKDLGKFLGDTHEGIVQLNPTLAHLRQVIRVCVIRFMHTLVV